MKKLTLILYLCFMAFVDFYSYTSVNAQTIDNTGLFTAIKAGSTYTIDFTVEGNYAMSLPGGTDGSLSNVDVSGLSLNSLPATIELWIKLDDSLKLETGDITTATEFEVKLDLIPSHKYDILAEGIFSSSSVTCKLEWSGFNQEKELIS
jgi:hypothetical protein